MNSKFSFRNIALLQNTYFRTNWKREIGHFLIQVLITLFICHINNGTDIVPILIAVFAVAAYAAGSFHTVHSKTNSLHYLSLPANTLEKLTSKIILSHLYVPLLLILATIIGFYIYHLCSGKPLYLNDINMPTIISMLTLAAIYMVGSLYCKKHPIIRTTLVLCGIGLLIFIICGHGATAMVNNLYKEYGTINYAYDSFSWPINISAKTMSTIGYICATINIIVMWTIAYFKLRETEA